MSWSVKEKNVTRIGRNNAAMVRWMCDVRLEEYHAKMFAESNIAMVRSSIKKWKRTLSLVQVESLWLVVI